MKLLLLSTCLIFFVFYTGEHSAAQNASVESAIRRLQQEAEQKIQESQYESGLNLLNQAYEMTVFEQTRYLRRNVLNTIANVYYQTGQYEQAERYYAELLVLDEESQDPMALSVTLFNMGHVYASRFQFSVADEHLLRSRSISQELSDSSGEAFALKALGSSAQAQENMSSARAYFNEAKAIFSALGNDVQVATVFRHLGDLESESNNIDIAIEHYLVALPVLAENSMDTALLRAYRGLGDAYEKSFQFDKALIAHHAYTDLLKFQLEAQNKEVTNRLQVEFETRKFAEDNTELEALNRDQEQELIHRADMLELQYVITGLVTVLMFQLGFLWWKSRIHAQKMRDLATRDVVTDLYNRRAILEHGDQEWLRAERSRRPFCCLMIDIDHFKSINDTWGHAVGDEALRAVSKTLLDSMRSTDFVGRFGGEEFLVLASESNFEQANFLAERIRQNIMQIVLGSMPDKKITVSIGVAQKGNEQSLDELIQHADKALYTAKETGRNKVELYVDGTEAELYKQMLETCH